MLLGTVVSRWGWVIVRTGFATFRIDRWAYVSRGVTLSIFDPGSVRSAEAGLLEVGVLLKAFRVLLVYLLLMRTYRSIFSLTGY